MNGPIEALYATGSTLYAVLVNRVDGTVWNNSSMLFETYNAGHWSFYAISLTEYAGSGYYRAAYPIASPSVLTTDVIYAQAGVSPTVGDAPASNLYASQGDNIGAVGNLWQAAQNMSSALNSQQLGSISGTPTSPTVLPTNLISSQTDTYAGRGIIMTSGTLIQEVSPITAYNGTTKTLIIVGFPSGGTPANGDTFVII